MEQIEEIERDDYMLTTIDNPYSPKTQYELWSRWDSDHRYNTEEYIARLISLDGAINVEDEFVLNAMTNNAIDSILANDTEGIYILV